MAIGNCVIVVELSVGVVAGGLERQAEMGSAHGRLIGHLRTADLEFLKHLGSITFGQSAIIQADSSLEDTWRLLGLAIRVSA
jgi:hypothetical protein